MNTQNVQNGTMNVVRSMATSVLFLVGTIGYSVYVLFELLGSFTGGSEIMNMFNNIMAQSGAYSSMDYQSLQILSGIFGSTSVISTLLGLIPAMVLVAGIWIVFAAAKQNKLPGIAATGMTMIRVIVIIELVFACIAVFAVAVIGLLAVVGMGSLAGYYGDGAPFVVIMALVMIVLLAICAIEIVYYVKLNGMVKSIKETMVTGRPNTKVSLFVEILCYLGGAGSAISALMSLVGPDIFGFLSNAGMGTAGICFGMLIRQYRNKMQTLERDPQAYQAQQSAAPRQAYRMQPGAGQQSAAPQQAYQAQPGAVQQGAAPQQAYQAQPGAVQQGAAPQQAYQAQSDTAPQMHQTPQTEEYGETTILGGQMVQNGMLKMVHLIRRKTGEDICINKESFWIGKDAGYVDYCIRDNTAISRRHALISIRDDVCYIQDNHSTNRVFVNGYVLEAGVDTQISNGDVIRMGDEEFTVSIG
ncbi:MAG TPA: FHA domain-containing protein [Candidatus Mediterraneibacter excrementipullorum]|nr:FHA domain-containing protein [Candidatus Mediterraneibacter excrementipullorum]